ncbi:DUF2194 domain-containing protein [Effusibacillus consociatus]|uniref:DUF2194 domain-containing protein n=1 Tax=Effusibacillus consociatus TaxID=1117041 RepID=A0ABV9Q037_9BACL
MQILLYAVLTVIAAIGLTFRISSFAEQEKKQPQDTTIEFETIKTSATLNSERVKYLLIVKDGGADKQFSNVPPNLKMAFYYSKLPLDLITWEDWKKAPRDLSPYKDGAVILLAEDQSDLKWADRFREYVEQDGGLLVNAWRSPNSPLNDFFGIQGIPVFSSEKVAGLHWTSKLYPGLSEEDLSKEQLVSSSHDIKLTPEMEVWAESIYPVRVPYLWYGKRGKGKVEGWNLTAIGEKSFRGVFIQGVLKAQKFSVKASVGAQVWYIDDFPAPVGFDQKTKSNNTGTTDYQFRLNRWNPDMQQIKNKYGIRYSAGVILNYSDQVVPPFLLPKYQRLFRLEQALIIGDGELGLHGYNHLPFMLEYTKQQKDQLGYPVWPSTDDMKQSLHVARESWKHLFRTSLPTMYIPPSNVLSYDGEKVLLETFPEIKTISSIYVANQAVNEFEQEFLPDPKFPQIMGTPRVSYGYVLNGDQRLNFYSAIANLGIVSHFNHPDDVFDQNRNYGLNWSELHASFDSLIGNVQSQFGWLRPLSATQLSEALRVYHQAQMYIDRRQSGLVSITLTPLKGPIFLEVRVPDLSNWEIKKGGTIVNTNSEYGILWIRADEPEVVLEALR